MKFEGVHIFDYDATFRGDVTIEGNLTISNSVSQTISFGDNDKLKFGDGNDLEIFHDGSNSYINQRNTGDLIIQASSADKDIILKSDDGSGSTTAYLTLDGGLGYTTVQKRIRFNDSVSLALGSDNDLQLSHDATNSYINNSTGNLEIVNNADDKDIIFKSDDGSGGTTTYFLLDGSSTKVKFNVDAKWTDNDQAMFGNGEDLRIYHDGSDSKIAQVGTGDLIIQNTTDDKDIILMSDDGSGGVTSYLSLDGSNTLTRFQKNVLFGDNTYIYIGAGFDFHLSHNGTDSYIQNTTGDIYIRNAADDKDIIFQSDDGSGGTATYMTIDGSSALTQFNKKTRHYDNVKGAFGNGGDMYLQHDGTDSFIVNTNGDLTISNQADDKDIIFSSDDGSGGVTTYFLLDGSATELVASKNLRFDQDNSQIYFAGNNTFVGELSNSGKLQLRGGGSNTAATVYIDSSGNMGLGTSVPSEKLEVSGKAIIRKSGSATAHGDTDLLVTDATAASSTAAIQILGGNAGFSNLQFSDTDSYSQGAIIYSHTDNFMAFKANASEKMRLTSDGKLLLNLTSYTGNEDFIINSTTNNGGLLLQRSGVNAVVLSRGGTPSVGIYNSSGNQRIRFGENLSYIRDGLMLGSSSAPSEQLHVVGNALITGDLTVSGTTVTVDTTNLNVQDKNITLNYSTGDSSSTADGAGITIQDAVNSDTDATILWDATNDEFDFSHGITLAGNLDFGNSGRDILFGDNLGAALEFKEGSNLYMRFVTTNGSEGIDMGSYPIRSNLTVGVNDTGHDVKFFGATASHYMLWDQSKDLLQVAGDLEIKNANGSNPTDAGSLVFNEAGTTWASDMYGFRINLDGSANNLQFQSANTSTVQTILSLQRDTFTSTFSGPVTVGVDDTGHDVKFFGDTSGKYMLWDASANQLRVEGSIRIDSSSGNAIFKCDTGNLKIQVNEADHDLLLQSDDGSGSIATYIKLKGNTTQTIFAKETVHNDDVKGTFGDSGDLQIYHNGSNSQIDNTTGHLQIRNFANDSDIIFETDDGSGGSTAYITLDGSTTDIELHKQTNLRQPADSEGLKIYGFDDHAASYANLYLDSAGHFRIQQSNAVSSGYILMQAENYLNLQAGSFIYITSTTRVYDNNVFGIGTGADFQMSNNGTDTTLEEITGDLYIKNSANDKDIIFQSDDGSGGVETYFFLDGSQGLVNFPDDKKLAFGTGNDLRIFHETGSTSKIENYTGNLVIQQRADDADIVFQCDDGSGGLTEYLRIDGSSERVIFSKDAKLDDNIILRIGSGNDLQIKHDGSNSYIDAVDGSPGYLYIRNTKTDGDINFVSDNGAGGEATYFFLDGSKATHNGSATTSLYTVFPDLSRLAFGNDSDLNIRHDGTDSAIENTAGNLYIQNQANDKDIIFTCDDGSGGSTAYLTIDGSNTRTNVHKNLRFDDSVRAEFGSGGDLVITHDGTDSRIENGSVGDLKIQNAADDKDILFRCDNGSGGVTTYFQLDGSTTSTVFSVSTKHSDSIVANFGSGNDLQIYHNGTDSWINNATGDVVFVNNADDKDIIFYCDDGSGGVTPYITLDGSLGYTVAKKQFLLDDNVQLSVGTSEHGINMVHDGSNSTMSNAIGNLTIVNYQNDGDIIFKSDDGTGSEAEYFKIDGGDHLNIFYKNTWHRDNVKILVGNGNDLQIYHDSNNTYMKQMGTGNLYIQQTTDDADIIFSNDDGSGGVTEYFRLDGSSKLNVFSQNARVEDNIAFQCGGGNDLRIYHDATDSYIDNATNDLYIRNLADDKDIIFQSDDGSGGVTTYFMLDGGSVMTQFNERALWVDNKAAEFGSSRDLQIYHDGSNSYIKEIGTGTLRLQTNGSGIDFYKDSTEFLARLITDGAVELYYDSVKKFETTNSGVTVTGNVTHDGLTPTSGTDIDQIKEFAMSFTLSADTWTDTGIDGTDLATGTYMMQVYVDDHNAGGGHYDEYYSATISWFSTATNSTVVDEIVVHRAGHAPNASHLQFRTQRHASGGDDLMLQVKQNFAHSAALDGTDGKTMTFKFRRLI